MNHIDLANCADEVRDFVLSLPHGTAGVVLELGGRPVARVVPVAPLPVPEWSAELDARRCALIDREIAGTIAPDEADELARLQTAMLRHRRRVAPLPLAEARQLHAELLAKAAVSPP